MATQGMVTIILNGKVVFKIIAGCEGMNATKLAKTIKEVGQTTASHLMDMAKIAGFGCDDDLVVCWRGGMLGPQEAADLPAEYVEEFANPYFNPRWKYGTAEYTEIVDWTEKPPYWTHNPYRTYPKAT